jgi:hypothetical protein
MKKKAKSKAFENAKRAAIRVGDGRGFVVVGETRHYVITASHCLPELPPPHPASYPEERTYSKLLGPLGKEPQVWAECLFVDPVADIAVLGEPDNQVFYEEWEPYSHLMPDSPLVAADTPDYSEAWLLSLEGKWFHCEVEHLPNGPLWIKNAAEPIVGGMSGSPILSCAGGAIGMVCTSLEAEGYGASGREGGPNPRLAMNLPGWMLAETLRARDEGE